MGRPQTTFVKRQREQAKRDRKQAKAEKRAKRKAAAEAGETLEPESDILDDVVEETSEVEAS